MDEEFSTETKQSSDKSVKPKPAKKAEPKESKVTHESKESKVTHDSKTAHLPKASAKDHQPAEKQTPHKKHDSHSQKSFLDKYLNYIIAILVLILAGNLGYIYFTNNNIDSQAQQEPIKVEIIKILASDCSMCTQIDPLVDSLKTINIEITSQQQYEFYDEEAKALIKEFTIKKLPTFIIKGDENELKRAGLDQLGEIIDDNLVFTNLQPPYLDLTTGTIAGKVDVIAITRDSCTKCYNISQVISQMKDMGIYINSLQYMESASLEGDQLVKQYKITKLPTLIFSKEIGSYKAISDAWKEVGVVAEDGKYILTTVPPPYTEVGQNNLRGLVTVTKITDSTCTECYDPAVHLQILKGLGVYVAEEKTVDIGTLQGKSLIEKYRIIKVPTIILSSEASLYPGIKQIWQDVGTTESDGTLVFREMAAIKDAQYRNLEAAQIENATSNS